MQEKTILHRYLNGSPRPKIRISAFKDQKVELENGSKFTLDADLDENGGNLNSVGIAYKKLPSEVNAGNMLLLDDGKIILKVDSVDDSKIITT